MILLAGFLFIPIGNSLWAGILIGDSSIQTGYWITPSETATATLTVTPPPGHNCTLSSGYWSQHPEIWPSDTVEIAGQTITKQTALEIMVMVPKSDVTLKLARELISAKINLLQGADPTAIQEVILEADYFLTIFPIGSDPPNPDRRLGVTLGDTLEQFNNGMIGPGLCTEDNLSAESFEPILDEPVENPLTATPTSTPEEPEIPAEITSTITPTQELSPTPEATYTLTPAPTNTGTPEPIIEPTNTETETQPPPEPTETETEPPSEAPPTS